MATDLETKTEGGEHALARPSLKITGLHIRGLKSINSLDLPEDGLGWEGGIPDFVTVGGINGSGKTTLLEFLAAAFECMEAFGAGGTIVDVPPALRAAEAFIDLEFSVAVYGMDSLPIRFLIGDGEFIKRNTAQNWLGFQDVGAEKRSKAFEVGSRTELLNLFLHYIKHQSRGRDYDTDPAVVYFPSERRTLSNTSVNPRFAEELARELGFVFRREAPKENQADPLLERLHAIRWEDFTAAKEEGWPDEAMNFRSYQLAFDRFFEGRKRIKWTARGKLIVETKKGEIHDLSELSSGEKQVILFTAELLHHWRPGSLILIDEPELHLHESYQTKLWEALLHWQKERGGQVIMATQSGHLFGLSGLGTRLILSRQSL